MSTKLTVQCNKAVFDPNDDSTQKFNEQTTMFQIYMDDAHVCNLKPDYPSPYFAGMMQKVTF
jgi:hypothetical protein